MILSCSSLVKSFQGEDVLRDISFKIDDHDKMAIIGINGAGKSTLLHIIAGEEEYDAGELNINRAMTIGSLDQEHRFDLDKSIYATLEEPFAALIAIEKRMRELEKRMAEESDLDAIMREYDQLIHRFDDEGGYAMESEIKGILNGLGFDEYMWEKPMAILSGGQKTRIALGQLLLAKPDLLLLDEPTNHLDIDSIEWLEGYLKNYNKAIIVVSHDRYFIDQVTTSIMEIENGRSKIYNCHYDEYAFIKKHERDVELKHYINNQKEIKRMQASIDLLKSFNREKQVKRAESKEKALARMEKVERPAALPENIRMSFDPALTSGYDVLKIEDLAMAFDRPLFDHISFEVKREERVALLGPNGIGKTTLFHLILNDYTPTAGRIKIGVKVIFGYYDQEQATLNPNKTIFQEISDAYPRMNNTEIRNLCAAFLFKGEDVFKTISVLSGGEKGRVVLMKLLLQKANTLLLDEPTNHLDIQSKEVLEDALLDFPGTILMISHDRYFINKLATKIVDLRSHEARTYTGNYDTYLANRPSTAAPEKGNADNLDNKKQVSLDRKTRNQIKKIESEMAELENEINRLTELRDTPDIISDYQKYNEITSLIDELSSKLELTMEEWMDLQESESSFL